MTGKTISFDVDVKTTGIPLLGAFAFASFSNAEEIDA